MTCAPNHLYSTACRTFLGLALASAVAGAAGLPAPPADAAALVGRHVQGLGQYAELPGSSFAGYHRVLIAPVAVTFRPDWGKEHPQIDATQTQRLLQIFAKLTGEEFARVLARDHGLAAADAPAADVLELRIEIVDFNINAPEIRDAAIRRDYVYSAGDATLILEVRDSIRGTLLARAVDSREMHHYYNLRLATPVTNEGEERDLVVSWARILRRQLLTARANSKGS